MLILSRKIDESIVIDGNITVMVVEVGNGRVRLGITAPNEVEIDRLEVRISKDKDREKGPASENGNPEGSNEAGPATH